MLKNKRKIVVITVGRSDWGIYYPILKEIKKKKNLELKLIVSGAHLSKKFGYTIKEIERNGFEVSEKVQMLLPSDDPVSISKSIGLGVIGFAKAYEKIKPDIILVLGDRFEMLSAVVSAIPLKIPIAHIHGGEETEGAFDNVIRHSITKMAHIHFTSTKEYAKKIIQMGEESWRVNVVGAPALDNLKYMKILDRKVLERELNFKMVPPPLLVTLHPVTLELDKTEYYIRELLSALKEVNQKIIFTMPNPDTYNSIIRKEILNFSKNYKNCKIFENLGTQIYFNLMKYSIAMVGNSSSGIIEAPSFKLPVVNIGTRQKGRIKARNVIDVGYTKDEIIKGINKALSKTFRDSLKNLKNPYGDGKASKRIVNTLKKIKIDEKLLKKKFYLIK